jgi:flavin reductase
MTQTNMHTNEAEEFSSATKERFRDAMARLAAAVHIVTTDGPAGRAGFTATAVCSVTDSPATLLVCLNRSNSASAACLENGVLCVNTLHPDHETLSNLFGGKTPMDERFELGRWTDSRSGTPMLADATVAFDCRVSRMVDVGTHAVLFCDVMDIGHCEQPEALLYFGRRYRSLQGI